MSPQRILNEACSTKILFSIPLTEFTELCESRQTCYVVCKNHFENSKHSRINKTKHDRTRPKQMARIANNQISLQNLKNRE